MSFKYIPPSAKLGNPLDHHPSQDLMISCGTIPIDPSTLRIAILHDPKTNLSFPPKGRKNIHESHLDAALRETHEETGLSVEALPLLVPTRATPAEPRSGQEVEGKNPDITDDVLNTEPICVSAFTCEQTGAFKLVFWFAGKVSENGERQTGTMEEWESHRVLEWVDAREASGRMSFAGDAQAVEKLLEDMKRTGYTV